MLIYRPKTIEQCLQAFGLKELDPDIDIVLTVELMTDICIRIIRIEDDHKDWGEYEFD